MRDLWCDICQEHPYISISGDGVAACESCMAQILDGIAEASGAKLIGPNRAERRAMKYGMRRRLGYTR